ncbi:MAG TPA: TMEM165/GDT1 family protein [Streptosporangiaceae bacterium]|nr:TMEM165/GDT1 family protein [Streptosporangiaceae bacterium]
MSLAVLGTVYPVIFISELPDKTMFASLVLATRGRALAVWVGAGTAFAVHVCIAVTVGAALFTWLPQRTVQALAAALFLGGAALAFRGAGAASTPAAQAPAEPAADRTAATSAASEPPNPAAAAPADGVRRVFLTTFVVVFLAEWGDLTQILTASLSARFNDPVTVGLGAALALWSVTALAVLAGRPLRRLPAALIRRLTGIVLLALAAFAALAAATGS